MTITIGGSRDCRICRGRLVTVLDLGNLHPSAFPLPHESFDVTAPLDLCQCEACGTVQLRHTVNPDLLFRHYWYRSGVNEVMRAELADIVASGISAIDHSPAVVVDIGANDGTLLAEYKRQRPLRTPYRIAYEPACNLAAALRPHCDDLIADYFPATWPNRMYTRSVDILTSIACFYDLDDPGAFVRAVAELLAPGGVWIVQFQDLHQMCRAAAFDNICHEHLVYYSLESFERLIEPYGLYVWSAERRGINGGSYRLIVRAAGPTAPAPVSSVEALLAFEVGCQDWQRLDRFAWHVGEMRRQILSLVEASHAAGQVIDLYGASTKGNTLLQYCGLDDEVFRQAWERSPEKWGRQTVTRIPIVSEEQGRAHPPDLLFCGIWQFRDMVIARERAYLDRGGALIVPLPRVDVVGGAGEVRS